MVKRRGLIQWIKEHKKKLIIAGIGIGSAILIILGIRNRAKIKAVWDSLKRSATHPRVNSTEVFTRISVESHPEPIQEAFTAVASNSETIPFEVNRHIRNLPDGWHASPEKISEAQKHNIILMDGQTWVDSYVKGGVVA